MTPEQTKKIVAQVLMNRANTLTLTGLVCNLIERNIAAGDKFNGYANGLLHSAEAMEEITRRSRAEIDELCREFGLPPIPPA